MYIKLSCGHVVSLEKVQMAGGCPDCMQDADQRELQLMETKDHQAPDIMYFSDEDVKQEKDKEDAQREVERLRKIDPSCVHCTGHWAKAEVCASCPITKRNHN